MSKPERKKLDLELDEVYAFPRVVVSYYGNGSVLGVYSNIDFQSFAHWNHIAQQRN